MKALVVLSGGQDSTTCLFWAIKQYGVHEVAAITFNYNQRHNIEVDAAKYIAAMANLDYHEVIDLGPVLKSTSPLTERREPLETYSDFETMDQIIGDRIEKTFVPMRNALFLTIAANRAVALDCRKIITGVCQQDNANYPDCREAFITFQEMTINEGLGLPDADDGGIEIITPLMNKSKAESIWMAKTLPGCWKALAYSHTAYDGTYPPTSKDHASMLRAQGFLEADLPDPLVLRAVREGLMERPDTPNYALF